MEVPRIEILLFYEINISFLPQFAEFVIVDNSITANSLNLAVIVFNSLVYK